MALFKPSALVAEIRGTSTNGIYSKNHYGAFVKGWKKPRNPPSIFNPPIRNEWRILIKKWATLTEAQRNQWRQSAKQLTWRNKLGEKYHPTGQLLFLSYSQNIFNAGGIPTYNYIAPTQFQYITAPGLTPFSVGYSHIYLYFTAGTVSSNIIYLIYATKPLSAGINYAYKYLRIITKIDGTISSPIDIRDAYFTRFGTILSNQKIFIKIQPIELSSGQAGQQTFCNAICS